MPGGAPDGAGARRLDGRVVLVAGASRGLGAATAVACAREGAKLVLVGRTRGALEEVDDAVRAAAGSAPAEEGASLVTLDLTRGQEVAHLGPALMARFGRLDGLVACAAELGVLTPVAQLDTQVLERTLAVNVVAQQRLITTLDPLLRAAPAGQAVFVTCVRSREPQAYWGAYAASKAALDALVTAYAAEQRLTSLRVSLFDPGPMATRLRRRAFPGESEHAQPTPEEAAARIVELLAGTFS